MITIDLVVVENSSNDILQLRSSFASRKIFFRNMAVSNGRSTNTATVSEDNSKSSNDYVMMFKSVFDRKLYPNDFDTWTVQEQYVWINKNIATFFPNVPKSLLDFIPATYRRGDCGRSPVDVPEWLDMDKYRRGQKFVAENYASVIIAKVLGLMYIYSFEQDLKPLILSKRSTTPYLAFKRYTSTIKRLFSWYNGEPWIEGTPAYKDMQYARKMHLMMREKLCELDNEQIDNETKIADPWCPDRELFLKDFAAACPFEKYGQRPYNIYNKLPYKAKGVNNMDMAAAQCGFIGLVLVCPQKIGIYNATDEDIEAFCHMWRCYGYCLGMEDEYNFCRGSLEEIRQRTRDLYQYWVLPNLKDVTPEWEHVTRCFIETLNYLPTIYMPYKMMAIYAMDTLDISMPHLYASMNYTEWIVYKGWMFIIRYAFKFSSFRAYFNTVIRKLLNRTTDFSSEKHAKLQEKSRKQLSNFSVVH